MERAKVSDFISPLNNETLTPFVSILPDHIINKIKAIPIPITDVKKRI